MAYVAIWRDGVNGRVCNERGNAMRSNGGLLERHVTALGKPGQTTLGRRAVATIRGAKQQWVGPLQEGLERSHTSVSLSGRPKGDTFGDVFLPIHSEDF